MIQPCDSFVIQKLKRTWSTPGETFKMGLVSKGIWKKESSKLSKPGKKFLSNLAVCVVCEVHAHRDQDCLAYAR